MKNAICLLIDRLHPGYLGGYGNTEIETPMFDQLAAESFVADRFYVDTLNVEDLCRSWWFGDDIVTRLNYREQQPKASMIEQLNQGGYRTVLVTDDPHVAYSEFASDFSKIELLGGVAGRTIPVEDIEQTYLCEMMAHIVSIAEILSQEKRPFFLWCHLRAFGYCWDWPIKYRKKLCGNDDPEPYSEVMPPFLQKQVLFEENGGRDEQFADVRQSIIATYAGGVMVFDELLEMLAVPLCNGDFGDNTLFLLAGTRGFLLGEQDQVGFSQTMVSFSEPFCSALIQMPLIVRFPNGFAENVRSTVLLQPADVTGLLLEWFEITDQGNTQCHTSILSIIDNETLPGREQIIVVADSEKPANQWAVVTQEWLLCKHPMSSESSISDYTLYVKPDDRWDVNDVSDRCRDFADELYKKTIKMITGNKSVIGSNNSNAIF